MNHLIFVNLVRSIHRLTKSRMDKIQKNVKTFCAGDGLSGGAYGETYEKVFVQVCYEKKLRVLVSPKAAVTDVYFEDYFALLQIKTNQGGDKANQYCAGKTKKKGCTRKEAVLLYVERVEEQFNVIHDAAKNFYLLSYNARANIFDIYHLAKSVGRKVVFINGFIYKQPKGYNPEARVGQQLEYSTTVLHKLFGEP